MLSESKYDILPLTSGRVECEPSFLDGSRFLSLIPVTQVAGDPVNPSHPTSAKPPRPRGGWGGTAECGEQGAAGLPSSLLPNPAAGWQAGRAPAPPNIVASAKTMRRQLACC